MIKLVIFMIFLTNSLLFSQLELKVKLLSERNRYIKCEPVYIEVGWKNKGEKEIVVGVRRKPTESEAVSIILDGRKVEMPGIKVMHNTNPLADDKLKAGEEVKSIVNIQGILMESGRHIIKYIADFSRYGEGYYKDKVESNEIEVIIEEPEGEDLMAYNWSKKKVEEIYSKKEYKYYYKDYGITYCAYLYEKELLENYPTSTYAGWVLFPYILQPSKSEPEKFINSPANAYGRIVPYPGWGDGWRDLNGEDYARWQIEKAEMILNYHPDFPFKNSLKLAIGTSKIRIGEEEEGKKILKEMAKEESEEGRWAKRYLEVLERVEREKGIKKVFKEK